MSFEVNKKKILFLFLLVLISLCAVLLLGEIGSRIYLFCEGNYIWLPDSFLGTIHIASNRFTYSDSFGKEFSISHRTNSLGLIGKEAAIKKTANVVRILILGDSFTEALQVKEGKNFCEQLELLLNKNAHLSGKRFEVINAGTSSYSPISEYLYFKRELIKLSPDIVILQLFANDVFEDNKIGAMSVMSKDGLALKINKFFMQKYWDQNYNVGEFEGGGGFTYKFQKSVLNKSKLFQSLYRARQKPYKKSRIHKEMTALPEYDDDNQFFIIQESNPLYMDKGFRERAWSNTKKYILAIRDLAVKNNAQFFMFSIPPEAQLKLDRYSESSGYFRRYPANNYFNEKLGELSKEGNMGYLDLLPLFEENKGKGLYYNWDGHIKEVGHSLVARALFDYLIQISAPVAQRIEQGSPKALVEVQFLPGALLNYV